MKKSILLLAMLGSLMLSTTACSGAKNEKNDENTETSAESPAMKLLNSVEFTKEGLIGMIKTPADGKLTAEEYEALILAFSKVKINEETLELESNPVYSARSEVFKNHKSPDNAEEINKKLMKSEFAQVRGYAIGITKQFLFGTSETSRKEVLDILNNEKDPYVIKMGINALSNDMKKSPQIATFILSNTSNKHAAIRKACTSALGSSWSEGVEGVKEAIVKLMNDKDKEVSKSMCRRAGNFHDQSIIPELVKILNDPTKTALHGSVVEGLYDFWYDFPFHEQTSKEAYDATIAYFKKTPRTQDDPAWDCIGELQTRAENNYSAWEKKATYFKVSEYVDVMASIAKDAACNWLARTAAVRVIAKIGSKADLKKLEKDLNASSAPDDKKNHVTNAIKQALEK